MRTTKAQRLSLALAMRQLRPDWSQDQLIIAIGQAADNSTSLAQLNAVGLIIARTAHTHPRTIVDDWAAFADLAAAAADATKMTGKPAKADPDPHADLRKADGTTDPAKQRAYIMTLMGLTHGDDQAALYGERHDGYSVAHSVGLDRFTHQQWTLMDTLQRARAINAWCRTAPAESARTESGLTLMLDVKALHSEAQERAAQRRERERAARVEWDKHEAQRSASRRGAQ